MPNGDQYAWLSERFKTQNYKPPAAFVAAIAALLPEGTLYDDSLDHDDPLGQPLVACVRTAGKGTVWSALGLVGNHIYYVKAESADPSWTWNEHRRADVIEAADIDAAWIRPISALRALTVDHASVHNEGGAGFYTAIGWQLVFDRLVRVSIPLGEDAEGPEWKFVATLKKAWLSSTA